MNGGKTHDLVMASLIIDLMMGNHYSCQQAGHPLVCATSSSHRPRGGGQSIVKLSSHGTRPNASPRHFKVNVNAVYLTPDQEQKFEKPAKL